MDSMRGQARSERGVGRRSWFLMAFVAASVIGGMLWAAIAMGEAKIERHPAEEAATQLGKPVLSRLVVGNDRGGWDIWLFSGASIEKMRQRLRMAKKVALKLKGSYVVDSLYEGDGGEGFLQASLRATTAQELRVSSHFQGSLIVLPGLGQAAEAPAWALPYRPLPIALPHGPIR